MGALTTTRTRLLILLCCGVACYGLYTAANGWYHNGQLDQDRAETEQRVQELTEKKAYLEGVRQYVASDAYVEQQARRQLGYAREGEVVFVVSSPPVQQQDERSGSWWERLFPR
ncbi:MAG: septum formation initiator family protein [Dehalococcoidia bacterium]